MAICFSFGPVTEGKHKYTHGCNFFRKAFKNKPDQMCWCNRKYHCWRWNFQLLTKCSHSFSEVSTLSLKNHRKHASERDGNKDRAQLTGHWLCRCDLFSLLLGLEYHPLDPLTGICNWVGAAVRAAPTINTSGSCRWVAFRSLHKSSPPRAAARREPPWRIRQM